MRSKSEHSAYSRRSPGLSNGEEGTRFERDVLLAPPPDVLDRNVAPELGMEGKSKGDAIERWPPSWGRGGLRNVSKGDSGHRLAGGIQGVSPLPCARSRDTLKDAMESCNHASIAAPGNVN